MPQGFLKESLCNPSVKRKKRPGQCVALIGQPGPAPFFLSVKRKKTERKAKKTSPDLAPINQAQDPLADFFAVKRKKVSYESVF